MGGGGAKSWVSQSHGQHTVKTSEQYKGIEFSVGTGQWQRTYRIEEIGQMNYDSRDNVWIDVTGADGTHGGFMASAYTEDGQRVLSFSDPLATNQTRRTEVDLDSLVEVSRTNKVPSAALRDTSDKSIRRLNAFSLGYKEPPEITRMRSERDEHGRARAYTTTETRPSRDGHRYTVITAHVGGHTGTYSIKESTARQYGPRQMDALEKMIMQRVYEGTRAGS